MDELRIPKRGVRVEVRFAGGASSHVEVYLADLGDGRERLSDLLESAAGFVTATSTDGGAGTLRHLASIAVARVDPSIETAGPPSAITPTELGVQVLLTDGSSVEGLVRYVK